MNTTDQQIAARFKQAGQEHHQAFIEVDGVDPEWPLWYASNLKPYFDKVLDTALTKSEIVALLLKLDQEHKARGADQPWPLFYAKLVAERYLQRSKEKLALYQSERCPYCVMVRSVIAELGLMVELRDIYANPAYREELIAAQGRGTVPVLQCTDAEGVVRWMPESRDIIRYLRQRAS